jgi:hypothetical protein
MTPEDVTRRVLGLGDDLIIPRRPTDARKRDTLIASYIVTIESLRFARKALAEILPRGGDYVTTDILSMALEAHRVRLRAIDKMIDDLTKITDAIS